MAPLTTESSRSGGGAGAGNISLVSGYRGSSAQLVASLAQRRFFHVWTDTCVNVASKTTTSCLTRECPCFRRLHSQTLAVDIMMNVERVTSGSTRRRRKRRLRSMLRHKRMGVAMALAEKLHHSACRSVPLKEELVEHVQYNAPRGQKTTRGREAEFFDVFDEELGGGRPPPLPEVAGPQARVLRRTVEPIIESFVPVPMIDVTVPRMVDQLSEVVKFFVTLSVVAEQGYRSAHDHS